MAGSALPLKLFATALGIRRDKLGRFGELAP
jgi:hypothetical protein